MFRCRGLKKKYQKNSQVGYIFLVCSDVLFYYSDFVSTCLTGTILFLQMFHTCSAVPWFLYDCQVLHLSLNTGLSWRNCDSKRDPFLKKKKNINCIIIITINNISQLVCMCTMIVQFGKLYFTVQPAEFKIVGKNLVHNSKSKKLII